MKTLITLSLAVLLLQPFTPANAEHVPHEVVLEELEFSQAELEQMLAPIALYPDTLLSHILIAATYPLEIIQAERWSSNNSQLDTSEIGQAIEDKDWDASVKALVPFPRVLKRMSEDLEWTQRLGDAFLQDEEGLLASIQILRQEAEDAGNLSNLEHMNVTRDEQSIIIEPAQPEVIYVPYYDPRIVYGSWRWNHYPPVYWNYPSYASYPSHYYPNSAFYWGPRVHISFGFGFGFSAFHWNNHYLSVLPFHYRQQHYTRRQIIHNQNTRRWNHNPVHRRGASYRTTTVRNRFNSNRPSRVETKFARVEQKRPSNYSGVRQVKSKQQRLSSNISEQSQQRKYAVSKQPSKYKSTRKNLDVMPSKKTKLKSSNKYQSDKRSSSKPSVQKKSSPSVIRAPKKNYSTKQKTSVQKPKTSYRAPQKAQKSQVYTPKRSEQSSSKSSKSYNKPQRSSSKGSSKSHSSKSKKSGHR